MSKVIVLNVGTEHALGHDLASSHPLAKSVWRSVWLAGPHDVIVAPLPVPAALLRYVGETLGFDPDTLSVIVENRPLGEEVLLSPGFVTMLRERVRSAGATELLPCFGTEAIAELSERIGIASSGLGFQAQRGTELLNRKSHFRQLAAGAGLPLAAGCVVQSAAGLEKAMRKHLAPTGMLIVKKDDAAGGMGNVIITEGPPEPLPGACETLRAPPDMAPLAAELWTRLTAGCQAKLVVESYHRASHAFYFEFFVDDAGVTRFLNSGSIRSRRADDPSEKALVWVGLDLPAELPARAGAEALCMATQFAGIAARLGYRGHLNVDAIASETGEIILNEVNGRWGGGLVLHAVAERLLGAHYADHHVVSSLRDVRGPGRAQAVERLRERGLHYSPATREGAVVLACDELGTNTMECVILGANRERVRALECELRALLSTRG